MNWFEKVISFLQGTMVEPQIYGWFHLMFLGIMVVSIILISIFLKKTTDRQNKIILLTFAIVCIVLEIYKQLVFSFDAVAGEWSYHWYAFPFQFCSTPMYVALIAVLLKKGKVQNSLYAFLATYGLLGGLMVMLYPGDVFISLIGINIQTMIHHGSQVLIGLYLLISKRVKLDFKTPLRALPTFLALVAIALGLNLIMVNFTNGSTFNMFFISPHFPSTLPVFSIIYEKVPYWVYLLLYIVSFALFTYAVPVIGATVKLIGKSFKKK